jgi:peptidoglycan/LPS O-acetylase OafA/YrhL
MAGYRLGFRGDIEGLRAIAILLVVAAHARVPWLAGGFVGVDVFFVLSGFLITGLLVREVTESGRIDFSAFYVRRLRRLMPAMLFMLLVVCAVASRVLAPSQAVEQASAAAMAAVWLSNFYFALGKLDYFSAGADANLFLHTWSLGVEEQFYLVWPVLMLGIWVLLRRFGVAFARCWKVVLLAVACASLVASLIWTPSAPALAFYMMPMRAWEFSLGGLLWALPVARSGRRALGWLGLVVVAGAALWFDGAEPYPGWRAVVPALGAALVIYAGMGGQDVSPNRLLTLHPLQWLGRISYAWYLWHWPVLLLGRLVLGQDSAPLRAAEVAISLLLAWLSYRCVELPLRHRSWWLTYRRAALLGSIVIMVLANVMAVRWHNHASDNLARADVARYARAHMDAPVIYGMGCDDWYKSDRVNICAFGPREAGHTAVLMGDSIAGQWFPAMARAFDRPGWRLLVLTKSSCPMVDEPFFYERIGREYTECARWRSASLAQVAAIKPDVLLLGTVSTNSFTQAQWTEGTARVLDKVSASARHIFILRGTPLLPFDGPDCLARHEGNVGDCSAPYKDEHADRVFAWLTAAASRFSNASMADFNDLVCPGGVCHAALKGRIVFRDSQHMTASYAESIGDEVAARLLPPKESPSSAR